MIFLQKMMVLMVLILVLGIGFLGNSARAEHVTKAKSYTTQNINVNKAPSSKTKLPLIEYVHLPEEILVEPVTAQTEPMIFMPKNNDDFVAEETMVLEQITTEHSALESVAEGFSYGEYMLGAEDKIKVTVFGEEDLSGNYKIASDGTISMPLIGSIELTGINLRQAEKAIEAKLLDGYLKKPNVAIEVQESRPFYIMGEVRKPGSYNYIAGMNVLQAVAISGGFTYRANKKTVDVVRGNTAPDKPIAIKPQDMVHAGDIIFVRERFF